MAKKHKDKHKKKHNKQKKSKIIISDFDPAIDLDTRKKLISYMEVAIDSDYPNMMNIAYDTVLRALKMHKIKLSGDKK